MQTFLVHISKNPFPLKSKWNKIWFLCSAVMRQSDDVADAVPQRVSEKLFYEYTHAIQLMQLEMHTVKYLWIGLHLGSPLLSGNSHSYYSGLCNRDSAGVTYWWCRFIAHWYSTKPAVLSVTLSTNRLSGLLVQLFIKVHSELGSFALMDSITYYKSYYSLAINNYTGSVCVFNS